jgi:TolB-like protein
MAPSPDEVRAQLERLLAAPAFASGRHPRFLRYVVEHTLAGQGDQLKEYVLGVEVFDRREDFDPRVDTIVRVEARRLRGKLAEYYEGPGAGDSVIIEIPRGSYSPVFSVRQPPPAAAAEEGRIDESRIDAPPPTLPLRRWLALAALSAALAVVGLSGWRTLPSTTATTVNPSTAAPPKAEVRIAVLPFAFFATDQATAMLAARLTDGVTTELARLGTLSVVSRTSAAQFMSEQRPVSEVASILGADLVMEGSAIVEGGQLKVVARLVDGVQDRKVWVGEYQGSPDQIDALEARIAAEAGPAAVREKLRN